MSVLQPDLKVFNYIALGLIKASYLHEVTEFYSTTMNQYFKNVPDIHNEVDNIVKTLIDLNELSYDCKYKQEQDKVKMSEFYKYYHQDIKAIQLYKYLMCVIYNIELCTIEAAGVEITDYQYKIYNLIKVWKLELMAGIIGETEEYKNANWSNI